MVPVEHIQLKAVVRQYRVARGILRLHSAIQAEVAEEIMARAEDTRRKALALVRQIVTGTAMRIRAEDIVTTAQAEARTEERKKDSP